MHLNFISIFFATILLFNGGCQAEKIEADILIINGAVYNGIDTLPSHSVVAIKGDKIIFVGSEKGITINAKKTIDAKGKIVCPGFIDPHTHADRELRDPDKSHNSPYLMQGVTTVVVGNDGNSFFPTQKFKSLYTEQGIGTNAILLTGHGTLRKLVVGQSNKKATQEEIANMQTLVQREMEEGSFGLSTGLFYAPGSYADTEEVIALAKIASKNKGIYDTHLRDEGSYTIGLKGAIEEAIEIGRQAKLPVHISHIKCLGVDVWSQSKELINLIEKSRAEGIEVTANQYPYDASATGLQAAVVPRWAESGGKDSLFIRYNQAKLKKQILNETKRNIARRGGADKLLIVATDNLSFKGKNLLEISEMLNRSPEESVFEVIKTGAVRIASFNMTADDIHNFMKQSWVVTGSDGNSGHPRKFGTFPRKYHKYIKEEKIMSVAQFINNSSSRTAKIFRIPNRGILKKGYFADIIVFNPDNFKDLATYTDAFLHAVGLQYNIVNGQIAVENGKPLGQHHGKVLNR